MVLTLGIKKDAVVIPYRALQTGQQGKYVFVITKNNTAEIREVIAEIRVGDDVVIEKGLNGGEIVVIDGQLRLTSGAKVEIKK